MKLAKRKLKLTKYKDGGNLQGYLGTATSLASDAVTLGKADEFSDDTAKGSLIGGGIGAGIGTFIAPGVGTAIGYTLGSAAGKFIGGKKDEKDIEKESARISGELLNTQSTANYAINRPNNSGGLGFFRAGGSLRKYNMGGVIPEFEAEKDEVIMGNPTLEHGTELASDVVKVGGETHENGGTLGAGGEFVFSDSVKLDANIAKMLGIKAKTYAEAAEIIGKKKGKFEKKTESLNPMAVKTGQAMLAKLDGTLEMLAQSQEMTKQPEGGQMMKYGGRLRNYGNGGDVNPNTPMVVNPTYNKWITSQMKGDYQESISPFPYTSKYYSSENMSDPYIFPEGQGKSDQVYVGGKFLKNSVEDLFLNTFPSTYTKDPKIPTPAEYIPNPNYSSLTAVNNKPAAFTAPNVNSGVALNPIEVDSETSRNPNVSVTPISSQNVIPSLTKRNPNTSIIPKPITATGRIAPVVTPIDSKPIKVDASAPLPEIKPMEITTPDYYNQMNDFTKMRSDPKRYVTEGSEKFNERVSSDPYLQADLMNAANLAMNLGTINRVKNYDRPSLIPITQQRFYRDNRARAGINNQFATMVRKGVDPTVLSQLFGSASRGISDANTQQNIIENTVRNQNAQTTGAVNAANVGMGNQYRNSLTDTYNKKLSDTLNARNAATTGFMANRTGQRQEDAEIDRLLLMLESDPNRVGYNYMDRIMKNPALSSYMKRRLGAIKTN